MRLTKLRRVVYERTLDRDTGSTQVAVTKEINGDAIFRVEENGEAALISWAFQPFAAIDTTIAGYDLTTHPTRHDTKFISETTITPVEDLKCVVYRRDIEGERIDLVTKEANGYLFLCYWASKSKVTIYNMFPDSTTAIDALVKQTRNIR